MRPENPEVRKNEEMTEDDEDLGLEKPDRIEWSNHEERKKFRKTPHPMTQTEEPSLSTQPPVRRSKRVTKGKKPGRFIQSLMISALLIAIVCPTKSTFKRAEPLI